MNKRFLIASNSVGASIGLIALSLYLMLNPSVQAATINPPTAVTITENGFEPAVITVNVEMAVVWINQTQETVHLKSGHPYQVYLPLILRNISNSKTVTPVKVPAINAQQLDNWADVDIAPGASYTYTFTMAGDHPYFLTEQRDRTGLVRVEELDEEDNIPCLVIVGQYLPPEQPLPPVLAGCITGPSSSITWRYDSRGAFIGFDLTVKDNEVELYEASIDIQRAASGRVTSYGGTVSGDGFLDFTESVVNTYNPQGGLIGAEVNKTYNISGNEYSMEITKFCPLATGNMTGYKVQVNGQEITIGSCP